MSLMRIKYVLCEEEGKENKYNKQVKGGIVREVGRQKVMSFSRKGQSMGFSGKPIPGETEV